MYSKRTIIYILGHGRSGSTLLDLLLASSDGVISLGQFAWLDEVITNGSKVVCTCGDKIESCERWNGVSRYLYGLNDIDRNGYFSSRLFFKGRKFRQLKDAIYFALGKRSYSVIDSVVCQNDQVLEILSQNNSASIFVDSSKSVDRYLALICDNEINVVTVFLMRDVVGVCRSKANLKSKSQRGHFLSSCSWAFQNILSAFLYHFVAGKKVFITLEDIQCDPGQVVRQIMSLAGKDRVSEVNNVKIDTRNIHMIAGNSIKNERFIAIEPYKPVKDYSYMEIIIQKTIGSTVYLLTNLFCSPTRFRRNE